jgi:hypothetical protein
MKLVNILYEIQLSDLKMEYKGKYFHGAPDISYLKSVKDIDSSKSLYGHNKSPFFYVTSNIDYAISHLNKRRKTKYAGIGIFDVIKNKIYNLNDPKELKIVSSGWENYMDLLENIHNRGYDIVTYDDDPDTLIILNKSVLKLLNVVYIKDIK